MDDLQAAVFERMRQAVGRLVRDGAGDALDGEIVLTVRDGQLVDVRLPNSKPALVDEKPYIDEPPQYSKPKKPRA